MVLIIGKFDKPYIENAKNYIRTTSLIEEIDKILDEKTIRLFGGIWLWKNQIALFKKKLLYNVEKLS